MTEMSSKPDQNDDSLDEIHFKWTRPIELSTGSEVGSSSRVVIPINPSGPKKALVAMDGGGSVAFENAQVHRFKPYNGRIENETHFAHLSEKHNDRQGSYIQLIFGKKGPNKYSHVGFQGSSSLFLELRTRGSTKGVSVFEEETGATVQGSRLYTDVTSGQTVQTDFILNRESCELEIAGFSFAESSEEGITDLAS